MTRYTDDYQLPSPDGESPVVTSNDFWSLAQRTAQALNLVKHFKRRLSSSTDDLDAHAERGQYQVLSGTQARNLGLPAPYSGKFESLPNDNGNQDMQTFLMKASRPHLFSRSHFSSGWSDWDAIGYTSFIPLSLSDTLDDLLPGKAYFTPSGTVAAAMGLPTTTGSPQRCVVEVFPMNNDVENTSVLQVRVTTLSATPGTFLRSKISGEWRDWVRQDVGAIDPESFSRGLPGQVSVWGSSTPAGIVPELAAELRPYGVEVHQKSRGGQWSSQTVANIGSTLVTPPVSGGTIPASGSVEINAADSVLDGVDRYLSITDDGIPGWLGGVYGRLVGYGTSFSDRGIRFERARPGSAVELSEPPVWVPEVKTPAHLNILGMGKNDLNVGRTQAHLDRVIARKDDTVTYWQDRNQTFLILGHFVNRDTPASDAGRTQIEADNADSATKYPENFIDMQELLSGEELWEWTGITPTSEDLTQQAMGNMPPSIQGSGNHLNEAGNQYLAWKIAQWMTAQHFVGQGRVPFANLYQAASP